MMDQSLEGKRVLITQANVFMGPVLCEVFAQHGAKVIASTDSLLSPNAIESVVAGAGRIDVLLANLGVAAPSTAVYVQAVGVEVASHHIQFNAIAQNFVDNPTYFPAEVQANPRFQERLKREVPLERLVAAREDAEFAAYLCSEHANCFVAQVFPLCGGWVQR